MDNLQNGITAFKSGKREDTRKYLIAAVKENPKDENAWGWLYQVANNDNERIECLKKVTTINPNNEKAKQLLNQLLTPPFSPTPTTTNPSPAESPAVTNPPLQKQIKSPAPTPEKKQNPNTVGITVVVFIISMIGLMILLRITMLLITNRNKPPIPNPPPPNNYVLDELNWLSETQEQEINIIASQLDVEGRAQIYVVTLNDCGSDKTQYRYDIFDAWKIGNQKSDGGLLILLCWYNGDKSRRSVEVKTDELMRVIIPDDLTALTAKDNFVPAFSQNNPGEGLVRMVIVFDEIIRRERTNIVPLSISDIILRLVGVIVFLILIVGKSIFNFNLGNIWSDGGYSDGGGDGGGSSTSF